MTAADFSNLHLQYKAEQAEGEVPAVIEHDFPGGRMVDHYFVTPSPAFWADEGVQSLDGVSGILFLQQPDGAPWKILVHELYPHYRLSNPPPDARIFAFGGFFCVFRLTKPISGCII